MALIDVEPELGVTARRRRRFVVSALLLLLLVFAIMVKDLMIGVIVGVMLWTMTRKMYQWFLSRVRRPGAAAGLSLVVTLLLIIVPITLLLGLAAADASSLADQAQDWFEPYRQQIQQQIDRLSRGYTIDIFGYEVTGQGVAQRLEAASGQIGSFLLMILQKAAGGVFHGALMLLVTLYTLFFFYLDGPAFIGWFKRIIPLEPEQSERLIHDFLTTAETSLRTMVIIGAIQGTLTGLAFWVLGIPSPFFWGLMAGLASAIPAVGTHIIVVPTAIVLILIGRTWAGIGFLIFGWLVIGHVDNVLRPYLVNRAIRVHQLLIFLATIGGIAMFGFWGVIIGPVIASLLKAVFDIYADNFKEVPPGGAEQV